MREQHTGLLLFSQDRYLISLFQLMLVIASFPVNIERVLGLSRRPDVAVNNRLIKAINDGI